MHPFLPASAGYKTSFHCWKILDPVKFTSFSVNELQQKLCFLKAFLCPTQKIKGSFDIPGPVSQSNLRGETSKIFDKNLKF